MRPGTLTLLYDGHCRHCDGAVQFVLRHDRAGTMRFAPLDGPTARGVLNRLPALANVDSLILLEATDKHRTRVRVKSDAVLAMARYLGWPWRALGVFHAVPRPIRDGLYEAFARVRYRISPRREACRVPDDAQRSRFLP